jgi:hypothetical protein
MATKNDPEAVRVARVRQLWLIRPAKERTYVGALNFLQDLERRFPQLLRRGSADPFQYLKEDLDGVISPDPKPDDEESR